MILICFLHSQRSCSSWCFRSPAGWPRARGGLLCPALRWERCWSAQSYSLSGPPETCCSPPVETDRVILHHYYLSLFAISLSTAKQQTIPLLRCFSKEKEPYKHQKLHTISQRLRLYSVKVSNQNWFLIQMYWAMMHIHVKALFF